jgi:sugar phosphate permease
MDDLDSDCDEQSSAGPDQIAASACRKVYGRIVLPLFITSIIAYLDRTNISFVHDAIKKDLAFTDAMFGFGAGIFFAGYVLFEVPGALIAERFSPKWWLARIMISWGLLTGLMPFVSSPWQFYLLRFLVGAAEASLYPVIYASVIPRWFAPQDRARAIAILLASLQISSIIGAPLAGWLIDMPVLHLKGWQVLFLLEAVPAVLFSFVLVWWMADSPKDAKWLLEEERDYLTLQYQQDVAAKSAVRHVTVAEALRNPEVIKLCGTYFLWMIGFWGFNTWMPTVLKQASGWSNLTVGWTIVIPMTLSLAVMLWIGHSSSQTGEKRWHGAIGLFLASAGLLCGTMTSQPTLAFFFMCMAAIGVYSPFGVWWSYPTTFLSGDQFHRQHRRLRRSVSDRLFERADRRSHRRLAVPGIFTRLRRLFDADVQAS